MPQHRFRVPPLRPDAAEKEKKRILVSVSSGKVAIVTEEADEKGDS